MKYLAGLGTDDLLVYNDAVAEQTKLFREWLSTKNIIHKYKAEWTPEMAEELEKFYLERYCL